MALIRDQRTQDTAHCWLALPRRHGPPLVRPSGNGNEHRRCGSPLGRVGGALCLVQAAHELHLTDPAACWLLDSSLSSDGHNHVVSPPLSPNLQLMQSSCWLEVGDGSGAQLRHPRSLPSNGMVSVVTTLDIECQSWKNMSIFVHDRRMPESHPLARARQV